MAESDKDDLISIIEEDEEDIDIPEVLPLMPVRDVVIFTDMLLPLFVGRKKSVRAVEEAVANDNYLMLATQQDPGVENPKPEEIYTLGTVARVLRMLKLPDGRMKALVQGVAKARIVEYVRKRSWYSVKINLIEDLPVSKDDLTIEALMRN
ncbi:MAG: LON peptidase substrate-binding domain-containing protein, partial [Desulfococcus multivorans]|nr:LON peptidase substrate-binding domain-containing protein [Desulfococcus multivorans]